MNYIYAIKTVDNTITKDSRTGQLEIYETRQDAERAINFYKLSTLKLDSVVELEYFVNKGSEE
jgi:hypothetical protein